MATALSRGHHVVVPVARDVRPRGLVVDVPALDRQKAAEALVQETGLDWGIADRYAAHARRNLLSLRRTLAHISAVTRPAWSQGAEGRRLAPLILAGSWTEDSEGDRSAIELLTGRTYADIEGDLALWGRAGGRPFAAQAGHGASCPRATRGTLAPRSSPGPTSGFVTMITAAMPGLSRPYGRWPGAYPGLAEVACASPPACTWC